MQFKYDKVNKINQITFCETDICYDCLIDDKCPLIGALQYNIVLGHPDSSNLGIKFCQLKV